MVAQVAEALEAIKVERPNGVTALIMKEETVPTALLYETGE